MFERFLTKIFQKSIAAFPVIEQGADASTQPNRQPENHANSSESNLADDSTCCGCQAVVLESGEIDFCGLMLQQTIDAHVEWVNQLRDVLAGKMPESYNPEIMGSDQLCQLGNWLQNDAKSLAKFSAYGDLIDAHRQFHQCAGEVVRLHQQGELAEAVAMLRQEIVQLSDKVQELLLKLHQQAQENKM